MCAWNVLGCGTVNFKEQDEADKGNPETAYLIWKVKTERRTRDEDNADQETTETEIHNRWIHAINKRLTIDRAPTNERFGQRAADKKLVRKTWVGCLKNEDNLPKDWCQLKGVYRRRTSRGTSGEAEPELGRGVTHRIVGSQCVTRFLPVYSTNKQGGIPSNHQCTPLQKKRMCLDGIVDLERSTYLNKIAQASTR